MPVASPRGSLFGLGASAGIAGNERLRVSFAGQMATHSRHPVHSADFIVTNWSTGRAEGQAFAHFAEFVSPSPIHRVEYGVNDPSDVTYVTGERL